MRPISMTENARAEGRESAAECSGLRSKENLDKWRDIYRAEIVRDYESGTDCELCQAGTAREEFLQLLAEWERGFDGAVTLLVGSRADRAAAVTQIAVRASALCSLLGVTNILQEANRPGNLRTCAYLADDIASDLAVFFTDGKAEGNDSGNHGGSYAH